MEENKMLVGEVSKAFELPIKVEENGQIKKVLKTKDTYLDKNIEVVVDTPEASFEVKDPGAIVEAFVSIADNAYTSDTETPYAITIAADAHADAITVGVKKAGFAIASKTLEVEAVNAEQDTKTIYVKEGTLGGDGKAAAEGNINLTKVGAQPEGGFYIKASGTGSVGVETAGWVDPEKTTVVSTDKDAYYTIKEATLSNNEEGDFAEVTSPVLAEEGYLFINEGYIANTKISLATLIPNDANIASENDKVYNTVYAYDSDGKLIAGTMGDAELGTITADDAEATITSVNVAADGARFKVTGTADISGNASVAVSKRGLAETTLSQNGIIEGTANVEATLNKAGLAIDTDSANITVTPVLEKEDSTTAKSGNITTVAPVGKYIAVSADAIAATTTVSPIIATEGYGTAEVFDATGKTITGGSAASGTYYIPLEAGSHTATKGEANIISATATLSATPTATEGFEGSLEAGILTVAPAQGEYITISADAATTVGSVSGTVTCTSTEGYIETSQKSETVSGNVDVVVTKAAKYIRVYDGSVLVD